jgi:putative CocE/NonD family hydrolase
MAMASAIRRYGISGFILIVCLHLLYATQSSTVFSNYLKEEYRVAMRDGTKLFTAVYTPRDTSRRYPILLHRTPYSVAPYGEGEYPYALGPSDELAREGFIFVYQDVRGKMMSEGQFVDMTPFKEVKRGPKDVDESSDTYDTIEWLLHNIPNHNGRVGMWGISYPGFYAAEGMIDAHPALKAVSPQAPIADWFIGDDFHHNGGLFLAHGFKFLASFGYPRPEPTKEFDKAFIFPTPDGYDFYLRTGPLPEFNKKYLNNDVPFWNELMKHGTYDSFWEERNLRPHLKNIKPAVLTVGGWFDAEDLFGTLGVYRSVESSSPGAYNILVMGPWSHGGWYRADGEFLGDVHFGADTAVFYRKRIEYPFFMHFLKGVVDPSLPEAYVFLTGTNEWRREDQWPPENVQPRNLYLTSHWKLSWEPDSDNSGDVFDEYISDPEKPVPYTETITTGMLREYMIADQRFASRRTDVLTYATDILDRDITVAGPVNPNLYVSTTGTDSDFVVKLIDVYPDDTPNNKRNPKNVQMGGYQQLIRGELFRGKFRDSFTDPEPFIPREITKIKYSMPDIFHTFRKGHRIMIQVQSSWFPLVDRNPQQFLDIYSAKASDFIKATQRIYRSRNAPSFITINQLK